MFIKKLSYQLNDLESEHQDAKILDRLRGMNRQVIVVSLYKQLLKVTNSLSYNQRHTKATKKRGEN